MPQAPEVFKRLRRRSATSPDKKTAVCPFVGVPSVVFGGSILPEPIEASSDGSWRWEPFEPGSPASCRPAGLSRNASAELLDFGLEHRLRSAPLSGAGGERDHAGHRQPMPVFHRGVAHVAELRLPPCR